MRSFKLVFIIMIFLFLTLTAYAKPIKIGSAEQLPTGRAIEAIFPDGTLRIVAASIEPIPKGISYTRGSSIAEEIASLKAETELARFIRGAEFEKTITVNEMISNKNDTANFSQTTQIERVSKMRSAALRGIEIIEILKDPIKNHVKVIVGISRESIDSADTFGNRLNRTQPDTNRNAHKKTSSETSKKTHWVHPSLKKSE